MHGSGYAAAGTVGHTGAVLPSTLAHPPAWLAAVGRDRRIGLPVVVALCLLVWFLRRPSQGYAPYVWAEEAKILGDWLGNGWSAAFEPPQGYLVLPAGIGVVLAAELSWVHLPVLEYVFATLFFLATIVALVGPDSRWGGFGTRAAMAFVLVLVPVNPETFGVLLYSFWWVTLWPLIILGWRRNLWALRAPMLVLASLSSPGGGAVAVLFGIEYARRRERRDLVSALLLLPGFVLEVALVLTSERARTTTLEIVEQCLRAGGYYVTLWLRYPDRSFAAVTGAVLLIGLLYVAERTWRGSGRIEPLLLLLTALGWLLISSTPEPLVTDPALNGPRYYFLPYVALGWTLVLLIRDAPPGPLRNAFVGVALAASFALPSTFSRTPNTTEARISWENETRRCAEAIGDTTTMRVYLDGSKAGFWPLKIAPERCAALLR